jgi:hypothetical protein
VTFLGERRLQNKNSMKKLSARAVILFFLIVASLCSYIYLNTVQTGYSDSLIVKEKVEENLELEEEGTIVLPDVTLMKRAFELGKRFVHN